MSEAEDSIDREDDGLWTPERIRQHEENKRLIATKEVKCVKCEHPITAESPDEGGWCVVPMPMCSDAYHGTRTCGCKCVFPTATPATEQGDEVQNNSVDEAKNLGVPSEESKATSELDAVCASNGVDVVVSGSLLVIRSPHFQQDAKAAVLTHPQAHAIIRALVAVHGNPTTQATGGPQITTVPDHGAVSALPESSSEPAPESQGVGIAGQCRVTCQDFSMCDCDEPHQCVLDNGHPFDPLYGEIHRFVKHMMPVAAREVITDKEKQNEESR